MRQCKMKNKESGARERIAPAQNRICCCLSDKVDALEYYKEEKSQIESKIRRIKGTEYRCNGTAFVTFNSRAQAEKAREDFPKFVAQPNKFWNKYLSINQWTAHRAPERSDIIWENMVYTGRERLRR